MEKEMNFAENVMLIDVALLNGAIDGAREALSKALGRTLPDVDLPAWLSYLALDAGLREGENEIQVILIHDDATRSLAGCDPSDLEGLRGQACRTPLGEFVFADAAPAGMTDAEGLFTDLMTLALDAGRVKLLMLLPDGNAYGRRVADRLQELLKDKEAAMRAKPFLLTLEKPEASACFRRDSLVYSLLRTWGVRADEFS